MSDEELEQIVSCVFPALCFEIRGGEVSIQGEMPRADFLGLCKMVYRQTEKDGH